MATAKRRQRILIALAGCMSLLVVALALWPVQPIIPVIGASSADWNHNTFWYSPWGASGVHKGIDIFAPAGREVVAATGGVVLFAGTLSAGGNAITILGPQWRLHYYAHLQALKVRKGLFVRQGQTLGWVGTTGNATGKPPHLHYSIMTLVPYPWRISSVLQGWKKAFYLDPHELLVR